MVFLESPLNFASLVLAKAQKDSIPLKCFFPRANSLDP